MKRMPKYFGCGLMSIAGAAAARPSTAVAKNIKAFADGFSNDQFQPIVKGYDQVIDMTRSALRRIHPGEADPEVAMKDAAAIQRARGM